jgi:hypothetical protein
MKFYTTLKMSALLLYCSTLNCSCSKNCNAPGHRHDTRSQAAVHPSSRLDDGHRYQAISLYQVKIRH